MTTYFTTLDSPVGELLLIGDGNALTGLYMNAQKYARDVQNDCEQRDFASSRPPDSCAAYFAGALRAFDLPLAPPAAFPAHGLARCSMCRLAGRKVYGALAHRIGAPAAALAVSLAGNHNPIGIIVPCHRVIGANGSPDRIWRRH